MEQISTQDLNEIQSSNRVLEIAKIEYLFRNVPFEFDELIYFVKNAIKVDFTRLSFFANEWEHAKIVLGFVYLCRLYMNTLNGSNSPISQLTREKSNALARDCFNQEYSMYFKGIVAARVDKDYAMDCFQQLFSSTNSRLRSAAQRKYLECLYGIQVSWSEKLVGVCLNVIVWYYTC
jgi:hypothetical protein